MESYTKIGSYSFSERCVNCPYVRLAVERKLTTLALFGPKTSISGFDDFKDQLRKEILEEIISTDGNLIDGSFAEECSGASLTFNDKANGYDSVCGRKILPFET